MLRVIAYIMVIPLVQFCLTAGVLLGGFSVAFLLAWATVSFRIKVAGFCGGILGVACAVAFGYGVFRLFVGPASFTIGAFLASTVPLLIPIRNDFIKAKRIKVIRDQFLGAISKSSSEHMAAALSEDTKTAHGSSVAGEIVGLALATVWFFLR